MLLIGLNHCKKSPKHVIVMLADDLGWNEVSWNNPQVITPHMEKIIRNEGRLLTQSYVTPKCSPSRAALMTGTDCGLGSHFPQPNIRYLSLMFY